MLSSLFVIFHVFFQKEMSTDSGNLPLHRLLKLQGINEYFWEQILLTNITLKSNGEKWTCVFDSTLFEGFLQISFI